MMGSSHRASRRRPRGIALPLMLFLLMALTLLAHGMLLLARRDLLSTGAFLQATQAGEAARSALWTALAFREELEASRERGSTGLLFEGEWAGGIVRGAAAHWLSRELFLVVGSGKAQGWSSSRRVGGVGWMMDPAVRVAALGSGAEVGEGIQVGEGGRVSSSSFFDIPTGWKEAVCRRYLSVLDSLFGGIPPLTVTTPPLGDGKGIPPLGHLGEDLLLGMGGDPEAGVQRRVEDPERGCPGSGDPVLWATEGSLTLRGGTVCGLLVVGGELEFRGEGLFQGVVLVGGGLSLSGAWAFEGMARVRGPVSLRGTSTLDASGCAALRTLSEIESLRTPLLLPEASSFRVF